VTATVTCLTASGLFFLRQEKRRNHGWRWRVLLVRGRKGETFFLPVPAVISSGGGCCCCTLPRPHDRVALMRIIFIRWTNCKSYLGFVGSLRCEMRLMMRQIRNGNRSIFLKKNTNWQKCSYPREAQATSEKHDRVGTEA
jgi:hypothetical protein